MSGGRSSHNEVRILDGYLDVQPASPSSHMYRQTDMLTPKPTQSPVVMLEDQQVDASLYIKAYRSFLKQGRVPTSAPATDRYLEEGDRESFDLIV
jgi:hypothetical protein